MSSYFGDTYGQSKQKLPDKIHSILYTWLEVLQPRLNRKLLLILSCLFLNFCFSFNLNIISVLKVRWEMVEDFLKSPSIMLMVLIF